MHESLCIIPARGGSKRIPKKNIRPFLGKPIIAYSIQSAIDSKLFTKIMVSTDDEEIAGVARDLGAEVPFMRSAKNADDFATTMDVLNEVVSSYEQLNLNFDSICCIYPTAPLATAGHLVEGKSILVNSESRVVFPVSAFSYPVWRGLRIQDNKPTMLWPELQRTRSQDLEPVYHDAGQWYWIKTSIVKENKPLFGDYSRVIKLEEIFVQDIDNLSDWKIAEMKYKLINHGV